MTFPCDIGKKPTYSWEAPYDPMVTNNASYALFQYDTPCDLGGYGTPHGF